ncbi:MAG: DUF5667 domain-containing protein, partial [Candidatus Promineifilaceae bacterium]
MRRALLLFTALLLLLVFIIGGLAYLAERHPLMPGDGLYPVQRFAERLQEKVAAGGTEKADFLLDMAGRRLEELATATTVERQALAADYFSLSLAEAVTAVLDAPLEERGRLLQRLDDLLIRAGGVVARLEETAEIQTLAQMITDLRQATSPGELEVAVIDGPQPSSTIAAEMVPFLGDDFDHGFFALQGGHDEVACNDCHTTGQYAGTPTECLACHLAPSDHYEGDCIDCHNIDAWELVSFDHANAENCLNCHQKHAPPAHYEGQCSNCHLSTENWLIITFDHTGLTDCQGCHETDLPIPHYPGQCSTCHVSDGWKQVSFSHAGFPNCTNCHVPDTPPNHYQGQCSNCHLSTENWLSISFDHTGLTNCQGCHESNRPIPHYPGQCSTCHVTTGWQQVSFNHSGFTDCVSCHSNKAPANHYPGQCSSCHNTSNWQQVNFSHNGFNDCVGCHGGHAPANHFPGQ